MSDVMIEARDLTKRYGDVTALDQATFEVRRGEVLGFLGPNGAGKTTTMKILTGFIAPTSGSASVHGCDVFDDSLGVRRALGYLPESNPLYVEMLVLEFLEWVSQMRGLRGEDIRRQIRRVVEETALGDVIAKEIRALSKGYRQRVGLAAALIHEPPILILDEPMSGLDPNQAVEIRELIKEIGRERTVILSTHNLYEVQLTCDRVLIISNGKIVADDRPHDLKARAGKPRYGVALQEPSEETDGATAAKAKQTLEAIAGVETAQTMSGSPHHEIHLELVASTNEDLRAQIFRAVADASLTLLELSRKEQNLESVFRELTVDDATRKENAAKAKKREQDSKADKAEKSSPKTESAVDPETTSDKREDA